MYLAMSATHHDRDRNPVLKSYAVRAHASYAHYFPQRSNHEASEGGGREEREEEAAANEHRRPDGRGHPCAPSLAHGPTNTDADGHAGRDRAAMAAVQVTKNVQNRTAAEDDDTSATRGREGCSLFSASPPLLQGFFDGRDGRKEGGLLRHHVSERARAMHEEVIADIEDAKGPQNVQLQNIFQRKFRKCDLWDISSGQKSQCMYQAAPMQSPATFLSPR